MDERITAALARVFALRAPGGAVAEAAGSPGDVVRPDTPLSALGPIDDAWPLLAAALDDEGLTLADADVAHVVTVGDLARVLA